MFIAAPLPAAAVNYSTNAKILFTYCTDWYPWRGAVPYDNWYAAGDYQTTGAARNCNWWFRLDDEDSTADYYVWTAQVDWKVSNEAYLPPWDNKGIIVLSSSIAAKGGIYSADPDHDIVLNQSCTDLPISIGAGEGFTIGVTITPRLCSGGKLNIDTYSSSAATWSSPDVTNTPRWEVGYFIKVGQGQKPSLGVTWQRPCYNKYRDPVTLYWKFNKAWCNSAISCQTR